MGKMTQDERLLSISTPLGKDYLLINKIYAEEKISELYQYNVELWYDQSDDDAFVINVVDGEKIVGQPVTIKMTQDDGGERTFAGIINNFIILGRFRDYSIYTATIVPHVWKLTKNSQSRIFQHKSVPDILRKIFAGFKVEYQMQAAYKPRNFCVQYQETDFDFASRLMEEEGIYYYFEHSNEGEKMILRDDFKTPEDCPGKHEIPIFNEDLTSEVFESAIKIWQINYALQTGEVTMWDYHYQLPTKKLDVEKQSIHNVGGNRQLENYIYSGGYARKYDGIDKGGGERASDLNNIFEDNKRTVANRMLTLDSRYQTVNGRSDCCTLTPGYRFQLKNHPNADFNGQYVLTSVKHQAEQSPAYLVGFEAPMAYENEFVCLAHGQKSAEFRPPLKTPKPVIYGSQTAVVVGPAGEEIFTDKYGRVKVQFQWDREGKHDPDSSCWLRVAQSWAGNRWGAMFIPRIGMEVMVDFLGGNPDEPIIIGSVYNPDTMPPYILPDEKTKMTIKSNSTKGGGGFNEFRFEDKKGKEQIFIHAEKDEDIRVKNDAKEFIGNERHMIVNADQLEKVRKDKHLIVTQNQNEKIGGSFSKTVAQNIDEKAGTKYAVEAGMEIHLKSGMSMTLEAGATLTLKVGGNFININPAGIFIQGTMVMINSGGAAGSGSGCSPEAPKEAKEADKAEAGKGISSPPSVPPAKPKSYSQGSQAIQNAARTAKPLVGNNAAKKKNDNSNKDAQQDRKIKELEEKVDKLEKQEEANQQKAADEANKQKAIDEANKKAEAEKAAEAARRQKIIDDTNLVMDAIKLGVDPAALKAQRELVERRNKMMEERAKRNKESGN